MNLNNLPQYELIKKEELADISSTGHLLFHIKSGARVLAIENKDENKVFNIAFRTPPTDSTGVAHILEHSVLCGSKNFPLKDPFVELVKGSLNTFLNAMTYPDKTMYPTASCNMQDFKNLMHVYLDAVFYPNIYQKEEIFRQEGWHYELQSAEDDLIYNGVVYNEMKGAFSSADDMLDREIFNTLFPDTPYGVESGGDPACIPDLTYEGFLDFHKKYYHPSNSYIYLYGDMDMEERLTWLDQAYLSNYDRIEIVSEIAKQTPFAAPVEKTIAYPIGDNEPEEDNTYLSWNVVAGDTLQVEENMAFNILEYALLTAPGAPLRKALLDAQIGKDVGGSYDDGILQPFFSISVKNANPADKDRFLDVIRTTLTDIVANGIDKKALEAGLNYFEFQYREADYASYPKGLMYGLDVFDSWLYDERRPFDYLKQLEIFEGLKARIGSGYYEELIKTRLLENPHVAIVTAVPQKGLTTKKENELAKKLADVKAGLSIVELEEMVRKTKALKAYQEEEDTEEAILSIPMLKREDIEKKAAKLYNEMRKIKGIPVLFHELPTNGIAYLSLLFDANKIPEELLPYVGLLKSVLGLVDTGEHSYGELFNEINANCGGITCGTNVLSKPEDPEYVSLLFGIRAKCLYHQLPFVYSMIEEILTSSNLRDEKRLYEIIAQKKSRMQMTIPAAGHSSAVARIASYDSKAGVLQEKISGIDYYKFIEQLEENYQEKKDEIADCLERLVRLIFQKEHLMIDFTADENGYQSLVEAFPDFDAMLYTEVEEKPYFTLQPEKKNEAFMTAGQVQYVAMGGNFRKEGYAYSGSMQILRMILNYDYLWMNLRVKGGAYGCMSGFKRSGSTWLVSYRDPKLAETLETYRRLPDYIRSFDADERQMTKYIIGTISAMDTPLTPQAKGALSMGAWFSGITEEMMQSERDEILSAGPEQIRALAQAVEAVIQQEQICVIGSEGAIEKQKDVFAAVRYLIGEE